MLLSLHRSLCLPSLLWVLASLDLCRWLILMQRRGIKNLCIPPSQPSLKTRIFNTHLDIYVVSMGAHHGAILTTVSYIQLFLVITDLERAVGTLISTFWARQGIITCGRLCDAQGLLQRSPKRQPHFPGLQAPSSYW